MKNVFKYGFLISIILLSGCVLTKRQRKSNKVAKKIEKLQQKYPTAWEDATIELVRIDTVLERIEVAGEIRIDTFTTENLVQEFIHDTTRVTEFITRFLTVTRDTAQVDTLGVHLFVAGSNVDYRLVKDVQHIEVEKAVETITITNTEVIRRSFLRDWKFWLFVVILTVLYFLKHRPRVPWLP